MSERGGVHISGNAKVGGRIFSEDATEHTQPIDTASVGDELQLNMKLGNTLENGGFIWKLKGYNESLGKYIYTKVGPATVTEDDQEDEEDQEPAVGSPAWRAQLQAKIARSQKEQTQGAPSFESIKSQFPDGAIADPDFVGGTMTINSKKYKMYKPVTQTQEGYVYIPA